MRLKYIAAFLVLLGLGCQPAADDSTTPPADDGGNGAAAPADDNSTSSTVDPATDELTLVSYNVTGMK